ncbi:hypothetical protein WJX84_004057 [Apatococcus fuscideae]|uniref:Mitochondrial zinc maintenance protein 1, mitochondrial n=1 Tax=Apatococcus fuscideae TaxID=2026836 RepID=A0AAW1T730_9CHLO
MLPQLAAYRVLLRSITAAFKGDAFMLRQSKLEVRHKYQEASSLTDAAEVQKRVAEAKEAADFIRTNVVQAKLNGRGNFAMHVEEHHADSTAEEAAIRPNRPVS